MRSGAIGQIEGGMAYLPPKWADRNGEIGQIEGGMGYLPPKWADWGGEGHGQPCKSMVR